MEISKSTKNVISFVENVKSLRLNKTASKDVQKIPLDEQTKNDFELSHDTELNSPMIYLEPDNRRQFILNPIIAYALANQIHIRKSKYNPGSTETKEILEHELTHIQQYSEGRQNESVDELELEANFNETHHVRNGEEVHYIEYEPGKYCTVTLSEYNKFLNEIARVFEAKVEQRYEMLKQNRQFEFLVALEEWSKGYDNKFFNLSRWW